MKTTNGIPILDALPVIFTKDKAFLKKKHTVKPGAILLLPEDAVLCVSPEKHPQPEEDCT